MKEYTITRAEHGVLCVVSGEGSNYLLPHCELHSPKGFECGYGGSGPADLAASILADHLGVKAAQVKSTWRNHAGHEAAYRVIRLHQQFKVEFIAPCILDPGESYTIREADIAAWVHAASYRVPQKLAASA